MTGWHKATGIVREPSTVLNAVHVVISVDFDSLTIAETLPPNLRRMLDGIRSA
jgi:hypothetical protein